MRVLHLISEKSWRGGEQQAAFLIEELARQHVESFVACRPGSAFEKYCQQRNVPYIALSFSKLAVLATAQKLKKYVNEHQVQLIHMHSSLAHTLGVATHVLGAKAGLILSRRVEFSIGKNPFSLFKYNYKGIRRIICVSDCVRDLMAKNVNDPAKCVTVHSGIDMNRFKSVKKGATNFLHTKYNIAPGNLLIGNVSAIDKHKDYYTFLQTAKLLKEQGIKASYFAIGTGSLEEEIKAYAVELGLQQDVIFTGFIKNIDQALPELDLFLFTTIKEGLGTAVLDAFACQVPVVASNVGGIPEMVKDGVTGFLAAPQHPKEFAAQALKIIHNPELRNTFVANASASLTRFTSTHTALETLKIYKQVILE
ncbi:glycosyltransferase family 4 protein [Pontibacter vulgaris]|uniref:glycosyltransferase family 4 protein n=1 Tax=Pontibacter vulgaris TaxID=2905679 RepID=UPI001FA74549|nr:glycosyltransferase family 4 protein [Pontibacter vulgaris]